MSDTLSFDLADEAMLVALAQRCAPLVTSGAVIYLRGDLGAGKTTFARALLKALGVSERIKSPTYSLIESYVTPTLQAWHLDLYRIGDSRELEWLGLDAMADPAALVLIEWPERGDAGLPPADLLLCLAHAVEGRHAQWFAHSDRGQQMLKNLAKTI
ncbi:MAG: tRNA (adenosine(37)-N6)-threonylcarbamoyltransferase complex ATPase subunit type 1 TsaE [Xanthomonadales bacterium]|nr:tRNA (adenosine(37)-N6)-threonylcarbamoyltransferase complex ATPase subunit type 1 TsaE [Xanthomonadales bacterium]